MNNEETVEEDEIIIKYGKAPQGEQIGDHTGDKKTRNRHIRRSWRNGNKILPDNKYRGFD